jgi:hypothetical protein
MLSSLHEALVKMFELRPALAADLLTDALGMDLPDYGHARLEPGSFSDLVPAEYRADAVVVLTATDDPADPPVRAVVVEVQLGPDKSKPWSWPVYLSTLRARLRCPTALLVVCVKPAIARWCAAPLDLGHPDWVLRPLVLGPDRVPLVTDARQAGDAPEVAVLSAMAYRLHPERNKVLEALAGGLASVDAERATLYNDIVLAALPAAARRYLEGLMGTGTYEYQSEFVRKFVFQGRAEGRVEGRVEGEAKAVLAFLDARGIVVSDEARARIAGCSDIEQLDAWIRRAATAESVDDLFD